MFLYKNQIGVGLSDIWISFSIGDDRSIDHIGTQSLSCRLSGGDSSTSGQGSGTSGATTGHHLAFIYIYIDTNIKMTL